MQRTESPTLWYQPPDQPAHRSRTWLRVLLVLFLLALVLTALFGAAVAIWLKSDVIMPGVSVSGIDVGGLSTAEAVYLIESQWQRRSIALTGAEDIQPVLPEALGFSLDAAATVEQAYEQGRSLSSLETLIGAGRLPDLQLIWRFDPAIAGPTLGDSAPTVAITAVNAGVQVVNGRAEATAPVTGRVLNVDATVSNLVSDPSGVLNSGRLDLVLAPVHPQVTDASAAAAAANQMLANAINLTLFDPVSGETRDHTLGPEIWGSWLAVEFLSADGAQFRWDIDETMLQGYLAQLSTGLGDGRYLDTASTAGLVAEAINQQGDDFTVRVFHHEKQHTVQAGETFTSIGYDYGIPYPWLQQANPGLDAGLFPGQSITVPSPDELLPLPVVTDRRIVVSITQQRAWVYQDNTLLWEWLVSTGIDNSPTWPGIYQIQSHEPNAYAANWDLWMPSFMGVYRPVPFSDFMNGFHGFPTRSGANLLWTGDLGRKVTYGCILLSSENAATLYDWAEEGTIVEIRP